MSFITLTNALQENSPVFVNVDHIVVIRDHDYGAMLGMFNDTQLVVRETPERVMEKIEGPS